MLFFLTPDAHHLMGEGVGVRSPLLSRLLDVVARNGKMTSKAHQKSLRKHFGKFLPTLILRSPKVKFSEIPYFFGNVVFSQKWLEVGGRGKTHSIARRLFFTTCRQNWHNVNELSVRDQEVSKQPFLAKKVFLQISLELRKLATYFELHRVSLVKERRSIYMLQKCFIFPTFSIFPRFSRWFTCVFPCWITWNNSFSLKTPFWPRPRVIFEMKCCELWDLRFEIWNLRKSKNQNVQIITNGGQKAAEWWEDSKSGLRI